MEEGNCLVRVVSGTNCDQARESDAPQVPDRLASQEAEMIINSERRWQSSHSEGNSVLRVLWIIAHVNLSLSPTP